MFVLVLVLVSVLVSEETSNQINQKKNKKKIKGPKDLWWVSLHIAHIYAYNWQRKVRGFLWFVGCNIISETADSFLG